MLNQKRTSIGCSRCVAKGLVSLPAMALVITMAGLLGLAPNLTVRAFAAPGPTMTTQFTMIATVDRMPAGTSELSVWVPVPSDNDEQNVTRIRVDATTDYQITREPKFGNRMVFVHMIRPNLPAVLTVRCTVTRKEISATPTPAEGNGKQQAETLARDLRPDRNVPSGGRYAEIARQVVGDKVAPMAKMRAIFDHTVASMQYDYNKESPEYGVGNVAFVCDYKKGNCSDLHSYLISLARSQGIPCELEYGFPVTGIPRTVPVSQEGTISGYHCWTWFYIDGKGWMPLDASDARRWTDAKHPEIANRLFGYLSLERSAAAFSRGRDIRLVPPQHGPALNNFIYPYAEANGKSVKADWEVRYKILARSGF